MSRNFRLLIVFILIFAAFAQPTASLSSPSSLLDSSYYALQSNHPLRPMLWQNKVDAWTIDAAAQGETEFLVYLSEQADLSGAASLATKQEKGAYVYEQLTKTAARTQKALLANLQTRQAPHQSFWVANMVWVRGDAVLLQDLASRADVAYIYANPQIHNQLPVAAPDASGPEALTSAEWGILKVSAPQVWAKGYTGQGVVIAGQDTGYYWQHPALINQYRGWNGITADHNYNWHDAIHATGSSCGADFPFPCDDHGHGTHTMGTMAGDDGLGNQVGMAPNARWIGCRNMNSGVGTPATYSECFQWFIAPTDLAGANPRPDLAPDMINNSWGCPTSEGCNWDSLQTVVSNTRAAGILVVASAGNSGNSCGTVWDPPAMYQATFSVGATDSIDNIASFSSFGPGLGTSLLKPDISAPGVSVRSSLRNGAYGSMSGTSMASPHVAGLAALLISAQPALRDHLDDLETLIEQTALPRTNSKTCGGIPGSHIPNNSYGWGRVDAWNAYQRLQVQQTASSAQIKPGQILTYTLSITPWITATQITLSNTLPAQTDFITATLPHTFDGATVRWEIDGSVSPGLYQVQVVVQVPLTATGVLSNSQYGGAFALLGEVSDLALLPGPTVTTPIIRYQYFIPIAWKSNG